MWKGKGPSRNNTYIQESCKFTAIPCRIFSMNFPSFSPILHISSSRRCSRSQLTTVHRLVLAFCLQGRTCTSENKVEDDGNSPCFGVQRDLEHLRLIVLRVHALNDFRGCWLFRANVVTALSSRAFLLRFSSFSLYYHSALDSRQTRWRSRHAVNARLSGLHALLYKVSSMASKAWNPRYENLWTTAISCFRMHAESSTRQPQTRS
ncbi:hypothetical protein JB92DRAFT_1941887 [Gautieria morchelliformis]|nr:hypothetical protein JB92DRAFT_1941887 [Gautieria morchelliformis]